MLNEDYSQPWYIPMDKRHLFRGINASGYLPPLEPHIEKVPQEPPYKVRGLSNKERDEINQLKLLCVHLQNTVYSLLDKKRKRKPLKRYD